jgi:hypothetical protein
MLAEESVSGEQRSNRGPAKTDQSPQLRPPKRHSSQRDKIRNLTRALAGNRDRLEWRPLVGSLDSLRMDVR